jgi:hypothetical protein
MQEITEEEISIRRRLICFKNKKSEKLNYFQLDVADM